jgi:hypothetical protein
MGEQLGGLDASRFEHFVQMDKPYFRLALNATIPDEANRHWLKWTESGLREHKACAATMTALAPHE